MIRLLISVFYTLIIGANLTVSAHTVWIEPKDGQLVIRFAEPGEKFETSPGFLDNLSAPQAFVVGPKTLTAVTSPKQADCFSLEKTSATNVVCVETRFTVRGGRKPIFYARWQSVGVEAGTPSLNLDLVPTGKPDEVRAYFRGQPLADVSATLRTPDEKEQDLKTDAQGILHFPVTQSGQYLLTIPHYREPLAGFYNGVAYKETSHNTALTWWQP
jgi:hypothetical protein